MAKKKKKGDEGGGKVETAGGLRWLITYADMITLLLGVFIILVAGGAPSESEIQKLIIACENVFAIIEGGGGKTALPGPTGEKVLEEKTGLVYNLKDLAGPEALITRKYTQVFKGEIKKGEMEVKSIKDALVIRCYGTLLFEHGNARIKSEAYPTLERIALLLSGISNKVAIEGHTDAKPIQTSQLPGEPVPSNWELSIARATNVLHYLIGYAQRSGFSKAKIEDFQKRLGVFGYAQFRPAVEDPYANLNNRIDIVIYHHKTEKELVN